MVDVVTVRSPVVGGPAAISNASLVAPASWSALAASRYAVPARFTLRSANVATPLTAATVGVPPSVPPFDAGPSATVTFAAKLVATLPSVSNAVTWTGGLITLSTVALWGGVVNARRAAAAGATSNAGLVAPRTPGDVATSV